MNDKIYTICWWGKRKRLTRDFKRQNSAISFMTKLINENTYRYLGIRYIEYTFDTEANDYIITFDTMQEMCTLFFQNGKKIIT